MKKLTLFFALIVFQNHFAQSAKEIAKRFKPKILYIITLFLLFACKKNAAKKDFAELKKQEIVEKPTIKIPDSISKNSIFTYKNENGFTRIWVKSNKNVGKYFYSDTLNILKIDKYIIENKKLNLVKEINLEETEWSYLEIDSTNITTKKIGSSNYIFITNRVANMGNAVPEQSVNFWMINLENIATNFNLQYFGYPSDYCNECLRGNFVENKTIKNNQKQSKNQKSTLSIF